MKDFGYDNFEKNYPVIIKFRDQGKLDDLTQVESQLDKAYKSFADEAPGQLAA